MLAAYISGDMETYERLKEASVVRHEYFGEQRQIAFNAIDSLMKAAGKQYGTPWIGKKLAILSLILGHSIHNMLFGSHTKTNTPLTEVDNDVNIPTDYQNLTDEEIKKLIEMLQYADMKEIRKDNEYDKFLTEYIKTLLETISAKTLNIVPDRRFEITEYVPDFGKIKQLEPTNPNVFMKVRNIKWDLQK